MMLVEMVSAYKKSTIAAGLIGGQYIVRAVASHGIDSSSVFLSCYVILAVLCIAVIPLVPGATYFVRSGAVARLRSSAPWAGPAIGWLLLSLLILLDVLRIVDRFR